MLTEVLSSHPHEQQQYALFHKLCNNDKWFAVVTEFLHVCSN
jgi:hypothetical protein